MTLRREVVDLVGFNIKKEISDTRSVGQIAMMQHESRMIVRVFVNVVDSRRVECARSADKPVDFVAFLEEQFGQIGSILTSDAGDQRSLWRIVRSCVDRI